MSYSPATVVWAHWRLATSEEITVAKGNWLWRVCTYPCKILTKVIGCQEIFKKGFNTQTWDAPSSQALTTRFLRWLGYSSEPSFIGRLALFFLGDRHILHHEPKVLAALWRVYHNEELFHHSSRASTIHQLASHIFPTPPLSEQDLIFTCSAQQASAYRLLILDKLGHGPLAMQIPQLQRASAHILTQWHQQSLRATPINITRDIQHFSYTLIADLLLGPGKHTTQLIAAIPAIHAYLVHDFFAPHWEESKNTYETACITLQKVIDVLIESPSTIPLFQQKEAQALSLNQKRALIFAIFFTGPAKIAALLTYVLWQLAKNPSRQNALHREIERRPLEAKFVVGIQALFKQALREFPPVYEATCTLKKHVCLAYRFKDEDRIHHYIMSPRDKVIARLYKIVRDCTPDQASSLVFGATSSSGCPGEALVEQVVQQLVASIISQYTLRTDQMSEIAHVGLITLQLAEDIYITLTPRS